MFKLKFESFPLTFKNRSLFENILRYYFEFFFFLEEIKKENMHVYSTGDVP